MPEAIRIRTANKCCALSMKNPYESFKKFRSIIREYQDSPNYSRSTDSLKIMKTFLERDKELSQENEKFAYDICVRECAILESEKKENQ